MTLMEIRLQTAFEIPISICDVRAEDDMVKKGWGIVLTIVFHQLRGEGSLHAFQEGWTASSAGAIEN
jgi:hypothetical protein